MTSTKSRADLGLSDLVHFILAALLLGVTACGSTTDAGPIDADVCGDAALAGFEEEFYSTSLKPWMTGGSIVNFDPELRFIALGEHAGASAGPDDEPLGGATIFFEEPTVQQGRCLADIVSATVSTTDVRVGTAEEANAKLFRLPEGSDQGVICSGLDLDGEFIELASNTVEFFYVGSGSARGWFCMNVQQVSPESGELKKISGEFAFPGYPFGN